MVPTGVPRTVVTLSLMWARYVQAKPQLCVQWGETNTNPLLLVIFCADPAAVSTFGGESRNGGATTGRHSIGSPHGCASFLRPRCISPSAAPNGTRDPQPNPSDRFRADFFEGKVQTDHFGFSLP